MKIHLRIHNKEKPYECLICHPNGISKSFAQKSQLNDHLSKVHFIKNSSLNSSQNSFPLINPIPDSNHKQGSSITIRSGEDNQEVISRNISDEVPKNLNAKSSPEMVLENICDIPSDDIDKELKNVSETEYNEEHVSSNKRISEENKISAINQDERTKDEHILQDR